MLPAWPMASAAAPPEVLFISASPVQEGKFGVLAAAAQRAGIATRHVMLERLGEAPDAAFFRNAALVLVDAPREFIMQAVEAKIDPGLAESKRPFLKLETARVRAHGLPDADAKSLWTYYVNGGRRNFDGFFRYLAVRVFKTAQGEVPPPVVYPASGIYHPDYPGGIAASVAEYLKWKRMDLARRPPVIGLAIHQSYLAAELTEFIDDTIRRIEAAGAVPLAFYGPVMDPDATTRTVTLEGKPIADAIISSQIMLNPQGRKAEFDRLGIPVIQAMPYRRGEPADWEKDPVGVTPMDIPFYLAQPEFAGIIDPLVAAAVRKSDGMVVSIPAQAQSAVNKALNLVRLQRTPNADKKIAVMFWNYPPGEKNLGASFMNVPKSLERVLAALKAEGYAVATADEKRLIADLTETLAPFYRDGQADKLIAAGLADFLPMASYRAWFDRLPEAVRRATVERFGAPERSAMAVVREGQLGFLIPRARYGNLVVLPQPPRGEKFDDKEKSLYHDTRTPPSHFYLAAYLWLREQFGAHALVHFGTHGTQEWLPGKERGLSIFDAAMLPLADIPVIYPYIVDDVGEAVQAKRRGRAVIVSHATPPFAPAGLHGEINRLHELLHQWLGMVEGATRDKVAEEIVALVKKNRIDKDMAVTETELRARFPAFLETLHLHLHELAQANQPLGLHTFGRPAEPDHLVTTVMQMLGPKFHALAQQAFKAEADEAFVGDHRDLTNSAPYRLLAAALQGKAQDGPVDAELEALLDKAREYHALLSRPQEIQNLIAALAGRHIEASFGGDPIKNPDSLPTGRNLYGFDPSRVPTKAAFEAGREAVDKLIAQYTGKHGRAPSKLAFALWSVETMRHFGVIEAQALWAMGMKPKWDAGGRVVGVEAATPAELKRPRVDVVLSATGLYRDHFPNTIKLLAQAASQAASLDEADNAVRASSRAIASALKAKGVAEAQAQRLSDIRIFSSESGAYGTGLDDAVLASDTWDKDKGGEGRLASLYLSRMQYGYGADEKHWGEKPAGLNLYAENLKGVEAATLSRTSNLYGMLTTDDPFQYLGGISLAVRHLTGKSPALFIANLREPGAGRTETAAAFLARELATRQFHPGWIEAMMKEGYAGTLEVLDSMNNFWGWQAMDRAVVRDDQWQAFHEVYVKDKFRLGIDEWFERHNPHAQAQIIERMLEAVRKDYWKAAPEVVAELKRRYRALAARYDVRTDNARFRAFVMDGSPAAGFGLSAPQPFAAKAASAAPAVQAATAAPPKPADVVRGQQLREVQHRQRMEKLLWIYTWMIAVIVAAGIGYQAWRMRREARLPSFHATGATT